MQPAIDADTRARYGILASASGIALNAALFALKLTFGLIAGSIALVADAIDSLSDCVTSVVVLVGFRMAAKPSDAQHPFGHGRMEAISTLVVSILLFLAGAELLKESAARLFAPESAMTAVKPWILVVLGLTVAIKEAMARFTFAVGKRIDSDALRADAVHHRGDMLSTVLVILALTSERFGVRHADAVGAVLVSLLIFRTAFKIARSTIDSLLGGAPTPELLRAIEETARRNEGVVGVHDIVVHDYGKRRLISLHIEVADSLSPLDLHALSERVELSVAARLRAYVVTHIDPVNRAHPLYGPVSKALAGLTASDARIRSFHDLRIVGRHRDHAKAVFDITLTESTAEKEAKDVRHDLAARFHEQFPHLTPIIKVEPKHTYTA
jgi:cation diffusion facilitator family transporter